MFNKKPTPNDLDSSLGRFEQRWPEAAKSSVGACAAGTLAKLLLHSLVVGPRYPLPPLQRLAYQTYPQPVAPLPPPPPLLLAAAPVPAATAVPTPVDPGFQEEDRACPTHQLQLALMALRPAPAALAPAPAPALATAPALAPAPAAPAPAPVPAPAPARSVR